MSFNEKPSMDNFLHDSIEYLMGKKFENWNTKESFGTGTKTSPNNTKPPVNAVKKKEVDLEVFVILEIRIPKEV